MKNQLNIPPTIRVGYQKRSDTYTGKLGYVIYYDVKGKLRKEPSFESWRHKVGGTWAEWNSQTQKREEGKHGKDMEPVNYDNVPTEGFVLNKKAGGYSSGWNHRATYCRVYDPRGFEFEISIPNLLFILQETNSIKGKGLEGEFVYSWEGKDVVLLPVTSQEYKSSAEFTSLKTLKITKSDMVEGCSYLTKDEKEVIYLGRYNWYELDYIGHRWSNGRETSLAKQHIFVYVDELGKKDGNSKSRYHLTKGFTGLAKKTSDEPVSNFGEIFEDFANSRFANKPIGFDIAPSKINFPKVELDGYGHNESPNGKFYKPNGDGTFTKYSVNIIKDYEGNYNERKYVFKGYDVTRDEKILMKDNKLQIHYDRGTSYSKNSSWGGTNNKKLFTKEELQDYGFQKLFVKLEKGNKIEIDKY